MGMALRARGPGRSPSEAYAGAGVVFRVRLHVSFRSVLFVMLFWLRLCFLRLGPFSSVFCIFIVSSRYITGRYLKPRPHQCHRLSYALTLCSLAIVRYCSPHARSGRFHVCRLLHACISNLVHSTGFSSDLLGCACLVLLEASLRVSCVFDLALLSRVVFFKVARCPCFEGGVKFANPSMWPP